MFKSFWVIFLSRSIWRILNLHYYSSASQACFSPSTHKHSHLETESKINESANVLAGKISKELDHSVKITCFILSYCWGLGSFWLLHNHQPSAHRFKYVKHLKFWHSLGMIFDYILSSMYNIFLLLIFIFDAIGSFLNSLFKEYWFLMTHCIIIVCILL